MWSSADAQSKSDDWQRANEATVRLSPRDFPDLPSDVRSTLEDRGCTIPQPYDARGQKKNVIKGRFTSAGQRDWAALCSSGGRSVILVFNGGHSDQVEEIAEEPDLQYLQVVDSGKIGYSRELTVALPKTIRRYAASGAQAVRSVDHDGIENTFLDKGSVVWYRSGGKWAKISGTD
jgi:hypothetical protein